MSNSSKSIIIFTDGAVPSNQYKCNRKGGVGVFFGTQDPRNISWGMKETSTNKVTNQVCELLACIMGIETLIQTEKIGKRTIEIRTDSMYVVKTISEWAKSWEKNNWKKADNKPVQNEELVKKLYYLSKNLDVKYTHVPAHKSEPKPDSDEYFNWFGNFWADKLAVEATK
jgi:ribonuclease HI